LPYILPSHSSMGWGLLRAELHSQKTLSRNVHPQNNANAMTSTYLSRCTLHNNHDMNKSSSSPRLPRNCELLPRIGSSARISQRIPWPRILPWARNAYNGTCAAAGPSVAWRIRACVSADRSGFWVILIKEIHICDSIGDVHDSITYCLLVDPLVHPSPVVH